jgi:hypothetical protein
VAIAPDASGHQLISLADAAAGAWTIQIDWTADGLSYYSERKVIAR